MKKAGGGEMRNGFFSKLWAKVEEAVEKYFVEKVSKEKGFGHYEIPPLTWRLFQPSKRCYISSLIRFPEIEWEMSEEIKSFWTSLVKN